MVRRGSPKREIDSPPRWRANSPGRRRPDSPYRRVDSLPPRRRPASPARGHSPSLQRRYRSPPRASPRRMRGSPVRRRFPPPPRRRGCVPATRRGRSSSYSSSPSPRKVILKPDPGNSQDLFIRRLSALGCEETADGRGDCEDSSKSEAIVKKLQMDGRYLRDVW